MVPGEALDSIYGDDVCSRQEPDLIKHNYAEYGAQTAAGASRKRKNRGEESTLGHCSSSAAPAAAAAAAAATSPASKAVQAVNEFDKWLELEEQNKPPNVPRHLTPEQVRKLRQQAVAKLEFWARVASLALTAADHHGTSGSGSTGDSLQACGDGTNDAGTYRSLSDTAMPPSLELSASTRGGGRWSQLRTTLEVARRFQRMALQHFEGGQLQEAADGFSRVSEMLPDPPAEGC